MRVKAYLCSKCHSSRQTRRVYLKEANGTGYRPIGYLCTKCRNSVLDEQEYEFPRPRRHEIGRDEPVILSGERKHSKLDNLDWVNS